MYFDYTIKKTVRIPLLRDLYFVLCWLDLDVLHMQRIIVFLNLDPPPINAVGNSNHMAV